MAEETKTAEPSMEEILASIRQIINQNDKPADGEGEASPADIAPEDTEVLELTNILEEGSVNMIDEEPTAPAPGGPSMEEIMASMQASAPVPTPAPAAPAPQAAPPPSATPAAAPTMAAMTEGLISGVTAQTAAAALGTLAAAAQQEKMEHSLPIGNSMRTLESMVIDAMKPLLKEWLDANLAGIVERIVQAEVEKLTKRLAG